MTHHSSSLRLDLCNTFEDKDLLGFKTSVTWQLILWLENRQQLYYLWTYHKKECKKLKTIPSFIASERRDVLILMGRTITKIQNGGDQVLWQYGLWSFQMGDTKLERFLLKNQFIPKENCWILSFGLMASFQKVPKFDFQSQFSMSKSSEFFFIENLGAHYLLLTFFVKINF